MMMINISTTVLTEFVTTTMDLPNEGFSLWEDSF